MWNVKNKNSTDITMTEGDFGIDLPFTIEGLPVSPITDVIRITVKTERNGEDFLVKEFTVDDENTFELSWTEEESALLIPGSYIYNLDWYCDGVFMCNIINNGKLKVEDKA